MKVLADCWNFCFLKDFHLAGHHFSRETWNKIFRPHFFATPWMRGYQASCLQDGRHSTRMYTESEHNKQVPKTMFFFNYFTRYSGADTQGVRNLFQTFHWVDLEGSIHFKY